jgi:hypothetical protein
VSEGGEERGGLGFRVQAGVQGLGLSLGERVQAGEGLGV